MIIPFACDIPFRKKYDPNRTRTSYFFLRSARVFFFLFSFHLSPFVPNKETLTGPPFIFNIRLIVFVGVGVGGRIIYFFLLWDRLTWHHRSLNGMEIFIFDTKLVVGRRMFSWIAKSFFSTFNSPEFRLGVIIHVGRTFEITSSLEFAKVIKIALWAKFTYQTGRCRRWRKFTKLSAAAAFFREKYMHGLLNFPSD